MTPLDPLDCIPHEEAVWRTEPCVGADYLRISVEYAGGIIAQTYVGQVPDWESVVRWRWGWAGR